MEPVVQWKKTRALKKIESNPISTRLVSGWVTLDLYLVKHLFANGLRKKTSQWKGGDTGTTPSPARIHFFWEVSVGKVQLAGIAKRRVWNRVRVKREFTF